MQRYIIHLSFAIILIAGLCGSVGAQTFDSSDAMRARVSRAKALIAMRNHVGAIFELENLRRETNDPTVHQVANVLLMHCYLEQGEYKRAENFLLGLFDGMKAKKTGASASYYAVAGQVIKSARNQSDRYKSLGLAVSDRNMPAEAWTDLDKMRSLLEELAEQAKSIAKEKTETSSAFSLLEEATAARSALARDEYDSNRWKEEVADAREMLADSRSVVVNVVEDDVPVTTTVASTRTVTIPTISSQSGPADKEIIEVVKAEDAPIPVSPAAAPVRQRVVGGGSPEPKKSETTVAVGSLIDFASEKVQAIYPSAAKSLRVTGLVRVEVLLDEKGNVSSVTKVTGPLQLQNAARDAALKWKFRPVLRDGTPVRASGFINFNFSL